MAAREWQRGYALEYLKRFTAPFRERHGPLVHGGFGLIKERDVAEALSDKRAMWTGGDSPRAIALYTLPKAVTKQTDFAQRDFCVVPGQVNVKAFAALDVEAGTKILHALCDRANAPLWIEIFEEDEIARQVLANVSRFSYVTTKILAGSEIKGIYTDGEVPLPALPPEELATFAVLDSEFLSADELAAIRAEVKAQPVLDAFALRGYDAVPSFIDKPKAMPRAWQDKNAERLTAEPRMTSLAHKFPATLAAVARVVPLDQCERVLIRRGDAVARRAESDRSLGVAEGRVCRLHIPVTAARMQAWDARGQPLTAHWPAGALCYLDARKPHAAGAEPDRVQLVLDVVCEGLRERIAGAAAAKPARRRAGRPEAPGAAADGPAP